jgi:hypothetical protein
MDNHHPSHITSHTNPTLDRHTIMRPRHTTHLNMNRNSSLCLRALGTPRLRLINSSSSPGHKALDTSRLRLTSSNNSLYHKPLGTPRLHPTNSSNSFYHKVLGYSRLHINPANSPNYTIAGLNHLSPPA